MTSWLLTVMCFFVSRVLCTHISSKKNPHWDYHWITMWKFMSRKIPTRVRESKLSNSWNLVVETFFPLNLTFKLTEWQVMIKVFELLKTKCFISLWDCFVTLLSWSLSHQWGGIVQPSLQERRTVHSEFWWSWGIDQSWGQELVHIQEHGSES